MADVMWATMSTRESTDPPLPRSPDVNHHDAALQTWGKHCGERLVSWSGL